MKKRNLIRTSPVLILVIITSGFKYCRQAETPLFEILEETVADIDGNVYRTVRIGEQVWMAENLKVTRYRDGTPIPNVFDNEKWPRATYGAYCMVGNDSIEYKHTYGVLYNFHAVSNEHGLCSEGWYVPTKKECQALIDYLGGPRIAGGKIKDNGGHLWKNRDAVATNESGFFGLPAGGRGQFGSPGDMGYYATWWSSTSTDPDYAWHWGVFPDKPGIRANPGHKASGFSVRCIKNSQ